MTGPKAWQKVEKSVNEVVRTNTTVFTEVMELMSEIDPTDFKSIKTGFFPDEEYSEVDTKSCQE